MKRLLVLVAMLAPLSWFIAGCGGPSATSSKSEPKPEEKQQMAEKMQQMMKSGKMNAGGAPQK